MLRVLGTIKRSVYAQDFHSQINDLGNWVSEIHGGMYPHLVRSLLCIYPAHLKTSFCLLTGCQRRFEIIVWVEWMQQANGLFKNYADGFNKTNGTTNNNKKTKNFHHAAN